ncbi:MAG: GNAT family N-acetyltransferase [Verrucomicrobia subdivision 3 bacterium]|nr:GNAT family N-acetyltransferase [Limisphaerales bacterium]
MSATASLTFKIATEAAEFEAIHRLNYKTFVEEIPQHTNNPDERLVDKFHGENTYAICLAGERVVGMVAGRAQRPFSLDHKLPNLDSHLPPGRNVLEVRLLSVEKEFRNGFVFSRLVGLLAQYFRERGFDLAIISGTLRQLRLYKHLGFVPFGPRVGSGEAQFQPMYLTLESFIEMAKTLSPSSPAVERILASYLPGPVEVHHEVRKAFERGPVSHRSDAFINDFRATKKMLCELTSAAHVEILVGSGSLANDAIGAQLSRLGSRGLILSNGEFGDRLIDHAARLGLDFEMYQMGWGEPFDYAEIRQRVQGKPFGWMWAVHCETSTGILNELKELKSICARASLKLCLDCISSIGTVPVELTEVHFASCASGKGLAAFPGLSMVFYNQPLTPAPLPRYLDLSFYAAQQGIPFTQSSNLIYALQTSLKRTAWGEKFAQISATSTWLRARLRELGFQIVAPDAHASPAVVSIALPAEVSSKSVGWQLQKAGYLLSYKSEYLLRRNWIQICLMGEWTRENLAALPDVLFELTANQRRRKSKRLLQTPA